MFISWIALDACIGIHVLKVIVRVGSCLDPSAVQRQPNRVISNVKGCYMALMVMPVASQGGRYTIAPPPSQNKDLYIEGGMANISLVLHTPPSTPSPTLSCPSCIYTISPQFLMFTSIPGVERRCSMHVV